MVMDAEGSGWWLMVFVDGRGRAKRQSLQPLLKASLTELSGGEWGPIACDMAMRKEWPRT